MSTNDNMKQIFIKNEEWERTNRVKENLKSQHENLMNEDFSDIKNKINKMKSDIGSLSEEISNDFDNLEKEINEVINSYK